MKKSLLVILPTLAVMLVLTSPSFACKKTGMGSSFDDLSAVMKETHELKFPGVEAYRLHALYFLKTGGIAVEVTGNQDCKAFEYTVTTAPSCSQIVSLTKKKIDCRTESFR